MIDIIFQKSKQKLFKETIWSFLSKGSTFVLFFAINIVLARGLGVDDFGTWSYFLSIITIVFTLSYFGINSSITKFLAEHNKTDNLRAVIRDGFKARILFSMGFVILFGLSSKFIADVLQRPEFFSLFLYSLPLIFLSGMVEFLKDVFIGLHRAKFNFVINLTEYGTKLLLLLGLFVYRNNITGIIGVYTVALLLAAIIGVCIVYRSFYRSESVSQNQYFKQIIQYSYPLFFVSLGFLLMTEIDTVMLGSLTTDAEVGIYAIAKQITTKMPHIAIAFSMGTMPIFAKLTTGNKTDLQAKFSKLLKINATIFGTFTLVILLSAQWFIPLIFGSEYSQAAPVLKVLSVYMVCYSFSIFLSKFLDYRGLAKKRAWNLSVTMILNIILNLILIPRYGAMGAAIGTTLSYLPYIVLNALEVHKEFHDLE